MKKSDNAIGFEVVDGNTTAQIFGAVILIVGLIIIQLAVRLKKLNSTTSEVRKEVKEKDTPEINNNHETVKLTKNETQTIDKKNAMTKIKR